MDTRNNAPTPDLRIVSVDHLHAHEEHDDQRSTPLIAQLQQDGHIINPPIVTPLEEHPDHYVILDGANRCFAFRHLEYPHIIVQVVSYESGYVELETWRHIVSGWTLDAFLDALHQIDLVEMVEGHDKHAIAHIMLRDGRIMGLHTPFQNVNERNAALREVVRVYQQNATLHRTAIVEPDEIWRLFPESIALMIFPGYHPGDIMSATRYEAFLPPGVSRHIIHGRALNINYPMSLLRDMTTNIREKNAQLEQWLREKLAQRKVRYYAEATYQFG